MCLHQWVRQSRRLWSGGIRLFVIRRRLVGDKGPGSRISLVKNLARAFSAPPGWLARLLPSAETNLKRSYLGRERWIRVHGHGKVLADGQV